MFEPTFFNRDENGLETNVNGFGELDYQKEGDEYTDPAHYTESATYKTHEALEEEPDLEQ